LALRFWHSHEKPRSRPTPEHNFAIELDIHPPCLTTIGEFRIFYMTNYTVNCPQASAAYSCGMSARIF
jgi:hypothetical protein